MAWDGWINKIVYIRLKDGGEFTFSKVLMVWDNFISFTDRDNLPVTINTDTIALIREEKKTQ